jgi:hypothetical protein
MSNKEVKYTNFCSNDFKNVNQIMKLIDNKKILLNKENFYKFSHFGIDIYNSRRRHNLTMRDYWKIIDKFISNNIHVCYNTLKHILIVFTYDGRACFSGSVKKAIQLSEYPFNKSLFTFVLQRNSYYLNIFVYDMIKHKAGNNMDFELFKLFSSINKYTLYYYDDNMVKQSYNPYELLLKESNVDITDEYINHLVLKKNTLGLETLLKFKQEYTEKTLRYFCYMNNKDMIIKHLDNKVMPTEDCIISLILGNTTNSNYIIKTKLISLLLEFGGKITNKIIEYSIANNIQFPEYMLKKHDIKFNEDTYELLHKYQFFTDEKYYVTRCGIPWELHQFRLKFRGSGLENILEVIKESKFKPDKYCFDNACMNRYYPNIVDYLVTLDVKSSLLSIQFSYNNNHSRKALIFNHYIKHNISKEKGQKLIDYEMDKFNIRDIVFNSLTIK